jgi:hypothetical protein
MAAKVTRKRYGKPGSSVQMTFLEGKAWSRAMDSKEIKAANTAAVRAAAEDFQRVRLALRFDREFMNTAPFFVRVTERVIFARARKAYKKRMGALPGTPDLRPMFERRFGGWDPWSSAQPPPGKVKKRNAVLLQLGVGGYKRSFLDRWRRASADYRKWAKALTRNWLRQQMGQYGPITFEGVLRRGIASGKITAKATSKRSLAEISIPRSGRQNRVVRRVFGGGGRQAIITRQEIARIARIMSSTLATIVEGKASAMKKKRGRKRA